MTRRGDTLFFEHPAGVRAWAAVGGKKEAEGPLGPCFDRTVGDDRFGCDTWEQGERAMLRDAASRALNKADLAAVDLAAMLGGDLLNQCVTTSFTARALGAPFLGLYNACATMAEALLLGAVLNDAGIRGPVLCSASSHFCTAERQYRFPVEYGGQRPPTAQWTATAAGTVVLTPRPAPVRITAATVGRVCDAGVTDAADMGSAMALSAYETLRAYFRDSGTVPGDFDLIATGDLGRIGAGVVRALFDGDGVPLGSRYRDCGELLFGPEQDAHAGASGCGCSAAVLCCRILPDLAAGRCRSALFCGTGALLSPTSVSQGDSIPGVCHLVRLERGEGGASC